MHRHIAPLCLAVLCAASMLCGCKPEQGEAVPITQLFTDAKLHGKYATVTGTLGISTGIMGSTSCKAGHCTLELRVPEPGWKPPGGGLASIDIEVSVGSGENEMAELPAKYSKTDVKVKAMGGKVIAYGERVKVSGKLRCHGNNNEDRLPCSMSVERIDAP